MVWYLQKALSLYANFLAILETLVDEAFLFTAECECNKAESSPVAAGAEGEEAIFWDGSSKSTDALYWISSLNGKEWDRGTGAGRTFAKLSSMIGSRRDEVGSNEWKRL